MDNSQDSKSTQQSDKPVSFGKQLKEFLPYFSILVIILGVIWQATYYSHFNIRIEDYIGVSELFLVIADKAFQILVFGGLLIFMGFQMLQYHPETEIQIDEKGLRLWTNFSTEIVFGLFFVVGIFTILIFGKGWIFDSISGILLMALTVIYPIIFFVSNYMYKINTKRPLNKKFFHLIYFTLLFAGVINLVALYATVDTEKGEYIGTKIYTKDSTYVSDSAHFYIGKTTNFYFIYNKDKESSTIIPEREVSKFELHDKIPIAK